MKRTARKNTITSWYGLCPGRHILLLAGAAFIAAYFLLRDDTALMAKLCDAAVRPYHAFMSRLCEKLPFSPGEFLIVTAALLTLWYLLHQLWKLIRTDRRPLRLYRTVISLAAAAALIYAGYCFFWGVYYYSGSFPERAGLKEEPVSVEQLRTVTEYFAQQANEYSALVPRDENGVYAQSEETIFEKAATLYDNIAKELPELDSVYIKPRAAKLSRLMSYIDFTGYFFPFTGEAIVNVDSPRCYLPSTIAHELSHQRGVAPEQEANFAAVVSCMAYGDPDYRYSAALLAYVHLGNALYEADRDAWAKVYGSLNAAVLKDFEYNREYWAGFDTAAKKVSNTVYEGFLKSYGQDKGLQSYGACVDLLVNYYYERLS